LAGSPLIADLALRVVDALAALDEEAGSPRRGWRDWQRFESESPDSPIRGHEHRLPVLQRRIAECRSWPRWDESEKMRFVQILLAPLVATEATVANLISHGDSVHQVE
ncbi:MAG: hypothetical protein AAFQ43_05330, partial [Bacteroidota bacterium]